jgi:predicted DNA-binding protein
VETPEGKRNLGRHTHRWKHKIIKDYREIKWEDVDDSHLAQER